MPPVLTTGKYFAIKSPIQQDIFQKSYTGIFSSSTFEKAKEIVMRSILLDNPKESLVLVMNDKIIYQKLGEKHSVHIPKFVNQTLDNPSNKIAIIHSHPDNLNGMTSSLSFIDFKLLAFSDGVESIYAINSKGEYAMLKKNSDFRSKGSKYLKYEKIYKSYIKKSETEQENALKNASLEYGKANNAILSSEHKFWKKYAKKLGVKYKTNFSYFD